MEHSIPFPVGGEDDGTELVCEPCYDAAVVVVQPGDWFVVAGHLCLVRQRGYVSIISPWEGQYFADTEGDDDLIEFKEEYKERA